jgi:hypothetical protein
MLKNFVIDKNRDKLVPNFACFQMDLSGPVTAAIDAGEVDEEFKTLPSWAKFAANPIKAKGFFTRTLQALFLGQGGHDELNVDLQANIIKRSHARVAMMFMPANTRNELLEVIGNIAQETLQGFEVIVLCGSVKYNGKTVNNRRAEQVVKEVVESGKPVLIIAAQMAQRSFSIPEITELYLAYDRGDNGATIQKMSRTLTPGGIEKVGRIFSLSFDPNRDDKFDAMIMETAQNHKARNQTKSLQEAMSEVLRTIDIYRCTVDGAIKIDMDAYLEEALATNRISRVIGKIINLHNLDTQAISALATGNSNYFRNDTQEVTQSGKTRESNKKNAGNKNKRDLSNEKELAKAREVVVTILENLDVIILGTNNHILVDAMATIEHDPDMRQCIEEEFGVSVETISFLFKNDIIKQDFVELLYDNA